ncbi:hypothetical protein [Nocardioides pyridinolyticus]
MSTNQPISRLDERVDDMLRALRDMPESLLHELIAGMRAHEEMAAQIGPDFPGAANVLAGTTFRRAFTDVMGEVLALKKKGAH